MLDKKNNTIPLLNPTIFTKELIEEGWNSSNRIKINDFFIHSFMDHVVPLKLPLPLHKKTVNDFVLIIHGSMTKTIGIESFSLKANEFLFTPKNSITTTKDVSNDLKGFYCHFSDDFIASNPYLKKWNTQPVLQNLLLLKKEEMKTLLPLLERIDYLYQGINEGSQNHQLIHYYLSTFIAETSIISENNTPKTITHPLVSKFQHLVNEKFKESKDVQFYASLLHISPNHLNKIVKKETGKTASAMINQICILEAKVLLTVQTDLDIMEVAHQLGFDDISYFSRFFKKHTATSPTNYRKMIDLS